MKYRISDDERLMAAIMRDAAAPAVMEESEINRYPKGSITYKTYRRERPSEGSRTYKTYKYECLYIDGVQYHLPGTRPDSELWVKRAQVIKRAEFDREKNEITARLRKNIERAYKHDKRNKHNKHDDNDIDKIFYGKIAEARKDIANFKSFKNFRDGREHIPAKYNNFTANGDFVRSKNEMIFSALLDNIGVPYLYEAKVAKSGLREMTPDFTLFVNGNVIHVELMGMLDEADYRRRIAEKRELYDLTGEKVVYINVTDGIDMAKLEKCVYAILRGELIGRSVTCAPDAAIAMQKSHRHR